MARQKKGRRVDGVLLLDKPAGMSSNKAVQCVKHLYGAQKAGHTGALDPLATGLLPICLGEATKFSQYLLDADKTYVTRAKLGIKTDTADAEGSVILERPVPPTLCEQQIIALLEAHFSGWIEQVPPVYSALKHQGQPLYKLARQGVKVDIPSRKVCIHSIKLRSLNVDEIELHIRCSKGTYIRSIVNDLGEMLGCGAHVVYLHRTQTGSYDAADMLTLQCVQDMAKSEHIEDETCIQKQLDALLLPPWSPIEAIPLLQLDKVQSILLRQGRRLLDLHLLPNQEWRVFEENNGQFLGVAISDSDGHLKAKRLLCTEFQPD